MENKTSNYDGNSGLGNSGVNPEQKQRLPTPDEFKAYEAKREQYLEWFDFIDSLGLREIPKGQ